MSKMRLLVIVFLTPWVLPAQDQPAQRTVSKQDLKWLCYFNRIELSPKWYLVSEIQERRFSNPDRQHQLLFRSHGHYRFHQEWDVSLGFTYFLQSPQDPFAESTLMVPELRPHVQVDGAQKLSPRWSLRHRYRLESRYFRNVEDEQLAEGYTHWNRFRYRLLVSYRLFEINQQWLRLMASDEIHFNFGKEIRYNRFDQNRIYIGANYEISEALAMEVGYMNWFQQRSSGVDYYNRHILRISVFHRVSFVKQESAL